MLHRCGGRKREQRILRHGWEHCAVMRKHFSKRSWRCIDRQTKCGSRSPLGRPPRCAALLHRQPLVCDSFRNIAPRAHPYLFRFSGFIGTKADVDLFFAFPCIFTLLLGTVHQSCLGGFYHANTLLDQFETVGTQLKMHSTWLGLTKSCEPTLFATQRVLLLVFLNLCFVFSRPGGTAAMSQAVSLDPF